MAQRLPSNHDELHRSELLRYDSAVRCQDSKELERSIHVLDSSDLQLVFPSRQHAPLALVLCCSDNDNSLNLIPCLELFLQFGVSFLDSIDAATGNTVLHALVPFPAAFSFVVKHAKMLHHAKKNGQDMGRTILQHLLESRNHEGCCVVEECARVGVMSSLDVLHCTRVKLPLREEEVTVLELVVDGYRRQSARDADMGLCLDIAQIAASRGRCQFLSLLLQSPERHCLRFLLLGHLYPKTGTPLQIACRLGHRDTVVALLATYEQLGTLMEELSLVDSEGRTALHYAACSRTDGNTSVLQMVWEAMPRAASIKDKSNACPAEAALKLSKKENAMCLISHTTAVSSAVALSSNQTRRLLSRALRQ